MFYKCPGKAIKKTSEKSLKEQNEKSFSAKYYFENTRNKTARNNNRIRLDSKCIVSFLKINRHFEIGSHTINKPPRIALFTHYSCYKRENTRRNGAIVRIIRVTILSSQRRINCTRVILEKLRKIIKSVCFACVIYVNSVLAS